MSTQYKFHSLGETQTGEPVMRIVVGKSDRLVDVPLSDMELWALQRNASRLLERRMHAMEQERQS